MVGKYLNKKKKVNETKNCKNQNEKYKLDPDTIKLNIIKIKEELLRSKDTFEQLAKLKEYKNSLSKEDYEWLSNLIKIRNSGWGC